ncbi:unnamed protein product [Kuraishia capsulata CBS 1993]|uniref:Sm domain-containing protein n=1 Tax=Kuraishia capsulata CBS 1993 TaxID=1382522 RepID=W6MS73_9ASCO|nr:uncharacterized protein KUCA_T00005531001 [Kuraishia capsulata CBS 1993]CDK29539.1 unnamed protein product [Kuraishia capsulata CBS 1993]
MLFFSFFRTLVDQELKNGIEVKGFLKSMDQYLNLKLDNISMITDEVKFPQLVAVRNLFIRGSMVRYIHLNPQSISTDLLQDASRRGK